MSRNNSKNRIALYPNQHYRALVVGSAIDSNTSFSDVGCEIIKNHFDKMPVETKQRLLNIGKQANKYK